RFLHHWPLDLHKEDNLFSKNHYVPRHWHHIVAQKYGDRMELYFDGVLSRSLPLGTEYPTLPCSLVVGRRSLDPRAGDQRPFVGRLDELAIYDHPLTAEEVQHHFQLAARPGAAG